MSPRPPVKYNPAMHIHVQGLYTILRKGFVTNVRRLRPHWRVKTAARPCHRINNTFYTLADVGIADEISILYELDMVTKLQLSAHKSELTACDGQSSQWRMPHSGGRAALTGSWTYSISPTTCIFRNATVCIQVIPAAGRITPVCRLHTLVKAAYARTAAFMQGRMQPACSLHASLVWTRHYMYMSVEDVCNYACVCVCNL